MPEAHPAFSLADHATLAAWRAGMGSRLRVGIVLDLEGHEEAVEVTEPGADEPRWLIARTKSGDGVEMADLSPGPAYGAGVVFQALEGALEAIGAARAAEDADRVLGVP